MREIVYQGQTLQVEIVPYCEGGSLGLQLYDADGLPYSRPTVNMPHLQLEANIVAIRADSVTSGLLAALVDAGVLVETGHTIPIGYTVASLCRIAE